MLFKTPEAMGQRVCADPRQPAAQFGKTTRPAQQLTDDQCGPGAIEKKQKSLDPAARQFFYGH